MKRMSVSLSRYRIALDGEVVEVSRWKLSWLISTGRHMWRMSSWHAGRMAALSQWLTLSGKRVQACFSSHRIDPSTIDATA